MRSLGKRSIVIAVLVGAAVLAAMPNASAGVLRHRRIVALNANQSSNWSGYNQGTIEKGLTAFSQVAGDWVVPTATAHKRGEAEYSSVWVGIGGGCIESSCLVTDNTLIQAGTEEDVDASGHASYSAWYEIIPAPSITITNVNVHPGDAMHVDIREVATGADVWTITVKNATTGQQFTTTLPYPSTHGSAEWIVETPLLIGTDGVGFTAMPKLTTVRFNNTNTNGQPAGLVAAEEMQLVNSNNKVIAAPSAPDPGHDGFNVCTYTGTKCAAPTRN